EELAYNGIHLTEFMKTEKKGPRLLRAWINIREGFDGSSAYKKLIYDSVRKERILNGNLTEIVRVCREHNVRVIFSGYPVKVANVDVVMKQVAESAGVVLVDQAAVFETLLGKYPREKFFVSEIDTHCISEGYRVMAKNIAGQIIPRGPSFE
ncbi:MAG: hypothetical protein PHO30_02505, partial [Candidatus Omnitrophica bacterium]|nr:hypothetical protein [Candidatus Omnitrophota bacterium]